MQSPVSEGGSSSNAGGAIRQARSKLVFSSAGASVLSTTLPDVQDSAGSWSARTTPRNLSALDTYAGGSQAMAPAATEVQIQSARKFYPRKKAVPLADPLTGERDDAACKGRNTSLEKAAATTSFTLQSLHTIFAELHTAHENVIYNRTFTRLHSVFDLKQWIYEKLLLPMSAYDLSYAEPGKATLTDKLKLLTTQDSLDTRTLAATQAVLDSYKGTTGVHSIFDTGVTRLYVRLKCRTCGDLVNNNHTCLKFKSFGQLEAQPETTKFESTNFTFQDLGQCLAGSRTTMGFNPAIEDCWHIPNPKKSCLYHARGYEILEAGRANGRRHPELARIYICLDKEPSKLLRLAEIGFSPHGPQVISY